MSIKSGRVVLYNQSINENAFPSSEAFEAIHSSLQSDEAGRKDAVKKGNAVFSFTLKNKEDKTESWHIDLKDKGVVAKGEAPAGKKADGSMFGSLYSVLIAGLVFLSLSDDDFGKLASGKTQAQRLFMSGKLKIKGDIMKATKMEPILNKAQIKPRL
ncbi:MAG: hypothetical protein Q9195_000746 [Heterodermia aff. obscurata]